MLLYNHQTFLSTYFFQIVILTTICVSNDPMGIIPVDEISYVVKDMEFSPLITKTCLTGNVTNQKFVG